MFREMRRFKQAMSETEIVKALEDHMTGVLAVHGDDDYPYTVPLNYVYEDGKIYFHTALNGHKTDAIAKDDKVSFCVIDQDLNVSEKFTNYYRSVVAFGRASKVTDDDEKRHALEIFTEKYSGDQPEENKKTAIDRSYKVVLILRIDIEYMSGKQSMELINK